MEKEKTKTSSSGSVSFNVSDTDNYNIKPYVKADGKYWYLDEDDRWVDLGLSVLWAKYNVGASSPEEYGGYYAWGETETKSSYTLENYRHATITGYDEYGDPYYDYNYIGNDISGTQYDVAHVKWGNGARMPRFAEINELLNYCSWTVSTYYGVKGMTVTGPNGNSIFLPFAGYRDYDGPYEAGYYGCYWSGTIYEANYYAYSLYFFDDGDRFWDGSNRICGCSVRPVTEK